MSYLDHGVGSHTCGQDIKEGQRVVLNSSDEVAPATASKLGCGVARYNQTAGDDVGIAYWNKPGTSHMIANEAIAVGEDVYAAPSGRIQVLPTAAGDYIKVGIAFEAAAELGDVIEVLPCGAGIVVTVTA